MESSLSSIDELHQVLLDLHKNPFPHIPNPPGCKKRASVALIVRVQAAYPDIASHTAAATDPEASTEARLASFFSQPWVQRGEAEVLFIKRAARHGDPFTSHVAFPGGKRDPEDADDRAAAVREASEEVGIGLGPASAIHVGNLAERVITSEWGNRPLMVLCPFVFLLARPDPPPLLLQPTEVHSAHWVPMRALTNPALCAYERADLSDRLTRQGGGWALRWLCRLLVGHMLYGGTRLVPSESSFCTASPSFLPAAAARAEKVSVLRALARGLMFADHAGSPDPNRPLLLWGLTHGIVADFLDLLPSYDVAHMWEWPTFSAPDVRLVTWLVTRRFRREKTLTVRPLSKPKATFIVDEGLGTYQKDLSTVQRAIETEHKLSRASAVGFLLLGYFKLAKRAVYLTLLLRTGFTGALLAVLIRRRMRSIGR